MYTIRKTRHFYGPKEVKSYVTDGFNSDKRAEFKFRAEAEGVVRTLDEQVYYLDHDESSRPEYKVVRIRGNESVRS